MRILILALITMACGTENQSQPEMSPVTHTSAEEEKKADPDAVIAEIILATPLAGAEDNCRSLFSSNGFTRACDDGSLLMLQKIDGLWFITYEITTQPVTIDGLTGYCALTTTSLAPGGPPMELQGPVESTDYSEMQVTSYDDQCQLIDVVEFTQVGVATYAE